jgi:plasmid maintenance system antidote protein VapI
LHNMDARKAELKRLIEIMGWSQTEAAKRLGKTHGAINHLVNPDHRNKPTQTTLLLLKMIIARERPELVNTQTAEAQEVGNNAPGGNVRLNAKERDLIHRMQELPRDDQDKVYAVIRTLLRVVPGRKTREKK